VPFELGNRLQWDGVEVAVVGAVIGLCGSWRERLAVGTAALLVAVPLGAIAALGTTNNVSARYIVFILPFYYLLVTLAGVLIFAAGGLGYYAPNGYSATRFKVDYRAAARYLAERLHPEDTVVFIDEPPHGGDVSRFYWHWQDPAHIYDVRDPRRATVTPTGAVYWVVGLS
jgi:hypothetical protein